MDDIIAYIRENYPEINESDMTGKTVYSLLFEKDGSISEVNVIRSIHPKIDMGIKAYYEIHNQWTSPETHKGKAVRYIENFVVDLGSK